MTCIPTVWLGLVELISGFVVWVSHFMGGSGFCTLFLCEKEDKVGGKGVEREAGGPRCFQEMGLLVVLAGHLVLYG